MAEAILPEVEMLASFGRALEGTINITQEDIDDDPSDDDFLSASLEALLPAKVKKRREPTCTGSVQDFAWKPKRRSTLL